jgi:hypothetical protein
MTFLKKFAYGASVAALAAMAPVAAVHAQQTAAELRGAVVDASGAAVAGARVTIIHVPTSTVSVATTTESGQFFASGLRVGGPYSVLVAAAGFEGEALDGLTLQPGSQSPLRIALAPQSTEVIVVTGQAINTNDLNNGVGSNFTARNIANQPSLNRDVVSTLLRDPLASSNGPNNLSVAGVNPRFNGVTIDGARQQDNFGLGSNTFATSRSPINIDIIESVSLVASDYGVASSGFTGGLVNVTTRGGTNEIDGSAFYYYRDQDFIGDSTFGGNGSFNPGEFDEKEYGLTLRGPIVRDRLFFSLSYDRYETAAGVDFAATDASLGYQPGFFEALNQIVQNTYGIDMGGRPQQGAVPEETTRYFARIDWNINDDHRLQVSYQQTEDTGTSNIGASNFTSAWYDTPTELTSYTAQLFSDWTPQLSTTLRASYIDFVRGQNCRAGNDIGQVTIRLNQAAVAGTPLDGLLTSGTSTRTLTGGCDRFRHANEFEDTRLQVFGSADYRTGDFIFTVGGEFENYDVYNLFVDTSAGDYIFSSVANLQNAIANTVNYRSVPSNNTADGAAAWEYSRWVAFGQMRWQLRSNLEVTAGARYEYYSQDDTPALDASFATDVGIPSTTNLDGLSLFMPRLSFRYEPFSRTTITGGVGLFAGGSPEVWISNAFQAPTVFASASNVAGVDLTRAGVPASLLAAVAAGTPTAIDAIDPGFNIPSDWKASLRVDQEFDINFGQINLGSNYLLSAQVLYTQSEDTFLWRNYAQTQPNSGLPVGTAPDGRRIYADLQDLGLQNRTVVTNGSGDQSYTLTVSLSNEFDNGFDFFVSYAFQDVEFITEGSSSRGVSSWRGQTAVDRNFPEVRTSAYQVEHAFRLALGYEFELIQDLGTRIDLFGQIQSGSPYTITYDIDNNNALFGRAGAGENPFDNNPAYIPLAGADPRVVYASSWNTQMEAEFTDFLNSLDISRGQVHEVNSLSSRWNQRWDLRVQQYLPGIPGANRWFGDNRFAVVLDVENILNLIDDRWGTRVNGPGNNQSPQIRADLVSAADVALNGVNGATALTGDAARTTCLAANDCLYRYNEFRDQPVNFNANAGSVWRARIGLRYEF